MGENDELANAEERSGKRPLFCARGKPERPLAEALVLLAALYFSAYLPADASAMDGIIARPSFFLYSIVGTVPSLLLVLYLMATTDGPGAFSVRSPLKSSLYRAALLATAALAAMFVLGALFARLGVINPLMSVEGSVSWVLIPLILASSALTGYAEELFFRAYLLRRLAQAGLSSSWAIAASTLIFAGAHGIQGIAGLATAATLGLLFALRFERGRDLHEIAIAHAAYNAAVFILALYS